MFLNVEVGERLQLIFKRHLKRSVSTCFKGTNYFQDLLEWPKKLSKSLGVAAVLWLSDVWGHVVTP